jgi:hypothetical protein
MGLYIMDVGRLLVGCYIVFDPVRSTTDTHRLSSPRFYSPFSSSSFRRKDAKKVSKLEAQIPYHEGRGDKEAAEKIRQQIADIWTKTREAAFT